MAEMHCMIDCETMDVGTLPQLLSGAALLFDIDGPLVTLDHSKNCFYGHISTQSCQELGGTVGFITMKWWANPELAEAREEAFSEDYARVSVGFFLEQLFTFMEANGVEGIWSCGLDFDISFLKRYAEKLGMVWPTAYNSGRDTRTLTAYAPYYKEWDKQLPTGLFKHHPLADCWLQARTVQRIHQHMKKHIFDLRGDGYTETEHRSY